ncbi:MAG: protein-L-isoaspartate(D-aspartate) O-methyltransferase [Planctomycetia bacterium]|nr:protein-L-isoaspartate(D-aspartate) O-methyltransferase [Planctomycetia bacterium]
MIRELREHGIRDERVLAAIAEVPRWRFVPAESRAEAWADRALPIAAGQTISQPYMVALMTQELVLVGTETVLEIGTGSGYQAAILSRLCRRVVTIERIPELSLGAKQVLESLGCTNVECLIGDGSLGCAEQAPFDRIIVTAGAPKVPPQLCEQLEFGGRLVIPTGTHQPQMLQVVMHTAQGIVTTDVCPCSFVPLIGAAAWSE